MMIRHRISIHTCRTLGLAFAAAWCAATIVSAAGSPGQGAAPPRLVKQGTATQLMVDGAPFLILGGEVGNSSGSADYLRDFWPTLGALNLNTLLVPVYWDRMEPAEGRFDFQMVDGLIREARANRLRLVLLWFGTWKNSMSCYAPDWVKLDTARFARSRDSAGRSLEILSPFAPANRESDARAFAALMRHLREIDGDRHTVVMVQVENEIGMIPEARDRSAAADAAFAGPVPATLVEYLRRNDGQLAPELRSLWLAGGRRTSGSWEQIFGRGLATDEVFTAWHFAIYTQAVAAAGRAEYELPMFANAALVRPGYLPGQYPSGGPLPHLIDVWRAAAPSIDFLSPDIYFPNFAEWCRRYARPGNPLFIPEAQRGTDAPVNVFYALAQHDAIGFAPFAIESMTGRAAASLARSYGLLGALAPTILASQGRGSMAGLLPESPEQPQPQQVILGGYVLRVTYERQVPQSLAEGGAGGGAPAPPAAAPGPAGGLVVATGPDEFLFAGTGVTVTFAPAGPENAVAGILSVEEGTFVNGQWSSRRWLNGDQTHQGRHLRLEPGRFAIQRIRLYRYREP
jgi:beta-galactosidase GanA